MLTGSSGIDSAFAFLSCSSDGQRLSLRLGWAEEQVRSRFDGTVIWDLSTGAGPYIQGLGAKVKGQHIPSSWI